MYIYVTKMRGWIEYVWREDNLGGQKLGILGKRFLGLEKIPFLTHYIKLVQTFLHASN